MIMVKRLTQPPAPSWRVWDTSLPASVEYTSINPQEWAELLSVDDVRVIQAAVRDRLAQAGERLLARNAELSEL
jgi:hypothetical protein